MIDTLRLNLVDCEIKRSCPLTVQPGLVDFATGKIYNENDLFIDRSGRIIRGSKAFLNDDKFNLTINPTVETEINEYNQNKLKVKKFHRIDEGLQPDIWDYNNETDQVKGIFLQTSLPRLLSETNLKTLSFDEQKTALKILEKKLKEYGIKTNIFNSNLSRLDTFTNLKTDYNFFSYSNLFSLMECSRMKSVDYADESFLWKNGNQQLAIYDKVLELKTKKPDLKFRTHKNIMRLENRLLKKRAIESKLKLITINDVYKNYDEVKHYHKKEIENKIFKYSFDEIDFKTSDRLSLTARICKNQFGDKWVNKLIELKGMEQVLRIADINCLLQIVEELDAEKTDVALRKKKSRVRKLYNDSKFYVGIINNQIINGSTKTNVELYNELKTKFYKEVA